MDSRYTALCTVTKGLGSKALVGQLLICTFSVGDYGCVSIRRPHFMANYITMEHKGCPISKAPPNAASFSLFLEDAQLLAFAFSDIPLFFARPK